MAKQTQLNRIIEILRAAGGNGMNSYTWRMSFIQLPVRILELKDMGYDIYSRQNADRSVNYILVAEPPKPGEVEKPVQFPLL